jgi:hypothetical protein
MQVLCCKIGCSKVAEWGVYGKVSSPDNNTYACDEHLVEMLEDENHVINIRRKA